MSIHIYTYQRHFPQKGNILKGGVAKAMNGLASGLVECGAKVTVLSESSHSENTEFKNQADYTIKCFANPIQGRPSFSISPDLKKFIRSNINSDNLVLLNGILHPSIYSMSRTLKKYSIPYIAVPHDVYHPSMFRKNTHLKWPYWYLLEKKMLNQAEGIQVLDMNQAKWLRRLGINTPIFESPNGFLDSDVPSDSLLQWGINEPFKIFYFGRIDVPHKGLDILLDGFAQSLDFLDAQLTFQGPNGDGKKNLEKQASELLAAKKVSFLKPEYNKPSSEVIAKYDIFCLPSRFEGFGLSALEAMLAARVLLVSEETGIARYVKESDCGVIVKPNASAIKSGLIELYQRRSDWKEMGLRGRRYVLKNLSWQKIAFNTFKQYKQLYTGLLN